MGGSGTKVLIVASWGNPGEWRPARYRLPSQSIFHEGLRRSIGASLQGVEACSSNCTTLALASFLRRASVEISVLVFGLDTLVSPGSSSDLKRSVEEKYREYAEKFIQECSCCSVLREDGGPPLQIVVTPGMGTFHEYAYKGSPVHIFNIAFSKILDSIEHFEPTFIIVDITHGVNYQMVAILYAAMAAAALTGMENRVAIFNSEPYPRRPLPKPSQQPQQLPQEEPSLLNILDVTQLSEALRFAQAVSDALQFRSARLSRLLTPTKPERRPKEGAHAEGNNLHETLQRLVAFVKLFENAAVGVTFPGAVDEKGEKLPYCICYMLKELRLDYESDYPPKVQGNTVSYSPARIETSLTLALAKVLDKLAHGGKLAGKMLSGLCAEEARQSLVHYMGAAARWLSFAGLKYAELIVKEEQQKLSSFTRNFVKCCEEIMGDKELGLYLRRSGGSIEVEAPLVEALAEQRAEEQSCEDAAERAKEALRRQAQRGEKDTRLDERDARNISAHAGLSYRIIRSVVLTKLQGEWVINRVVFNREMVKQYLKIIGVHEDQFDGGAA